jgi:hypothetical protein
MQQWSRDRRAAAIDGQLADEIGAPFTLYLRPFTSTGRVRIPLKSVVLKRGVIAGPATTWDPQLGRTSRFKRYVTFGDFETELADGVDPQAPLVALGKPGEQIGAGRIVTSDEDWQAKFNQLATRAVAIVLVPSLRPGTRAETDAILSTPEWVIKTMFFVPPDDTVLGAGAGPHLEVGAKSGPLGALSLRDDAIEALRRSPQVPVKDLQHDQAGVLLRLDSKGGVRFYYALQIKQSFSLLSSVGSDLHLDMTGLQQEIRRFLNERLDVRSKEEAEGSESVTPR